jgi:hypothetical protein
MTDINRAPVASPSLAARRKPSCLLCGRPSTFTNVYIPGKHTPVAPPPGKGRIIIYSLCDHCAERLDELGEIIEARIESDLRATGAI